MTEDARDTAFAQFAGAHLPTDVERAVFWVLAGSSSQVWTAADVASEAGMSEHEVDQALRRFAAAAILERTDDPAGPRSYRWRPEMAYLHDRGDAPGLIDPVCGMPVPPDSPHVVQDGEGRDVIFCSFPCLVRWRSEHRDDGRRTRARRTSRSSRWVDHEPPS